MSELSFIHCCRRVLLGASPIIVCCHNGLIISLMTLLLWCSSHFADWPLRLLLGEWVHAPACGHQCTGSGTPPSSSELSGPTESVSTVELQSSWRQSSGTPNSCRRNLQLRGSVACTATGGSSTLVFAPALGVDRHIHVLVDVLGLWDLSCSLCFGSWRHVCVTTGTSTIYSGVCCRTRSFNGWTCRSWTAARSASALQEFGKSGFSSFLTSIRTGLDDIRLLGLFIGISSDTCTICSRDRSETRSCAITLIISAICSTAISATGISTISVTVHLWGLRGPLDRLCHWHLSLRLSCLDGWYLALRHNCCVRGLVSVLDLWELHGLLLVRIASFCIIADTSAILPM